MIGEAAATQLNEIIGNYRADPMLTRDGNFVDRSTCEKYFTSLITRQIKATALGFHFPFRLRSHVNFGGIT
jgi:hypothetical protein